MQIKQQNIFYKTDTFEIDQSHVFKYDCLFAAKNLETMNNG